MNAEINHIGTRIRQRRKELKIRQRVLCEAVQISENYLSQIENGRLLPSIGVLSRITEYLDISPAADDFPEPVRVELKKLISEHGITAARLGLEQLHKEIVAATNSR